MLMLISARSNCENCDISISISTSWHKKNKHVRFSYAYAYAYAYVAATSFPGSLLGTRLMSRVFSLAYAYALVRTSL